MLLDDLAICRRLDDQHGMGISYLNLGEINHRRGTQSWPQALQYFRQARTVFQQFNNRYLETDLLVNMGALFQDMQQGHRALTCYRRGVSMIESLRARISAEEGRSSFFATVVKSYGALIKLYILQGNVVRAFEMVERAWARSFVELLASQPPDSSQRIAPSLLAQEQRLRQQLQQLYANDESDVEEINSIESAREQSHAPNATRSTANMSISHRTTTHT